MAGLALISLYDPQEGARELERVARIGLKGAMIWCSPPQEQPYSSDIYDPFWAAAQEMKMPVSLHAITGMGVESQWNWGERYMRSTVLSHEVEKSFSVLIFSGVLDRFPRLQIVSAENNCGWIPYYLQRMDRAFERQRVAAGFPNKLKPSEYFQRQMWCTYIDDFVGVASRQFIGVDRMMWSSDYPHQASSWPHSQEVVARDFATRARRIATRSPAATPRISTASRPECRWQPGRRRDWPRPGRGYDPRHGPAAVPPGYRASCNSRPQRPRQPCARPWCAGAAAENNVQQKV